ncbi:hypothetical protein ACFL0N_01885 [Pseudomonadota bacterium]
MKYGFILVCMALLFALAPSTLPAADTEELKVEADQFYVEQNYKKAYKIYYKLAKQGDHYSQGQLANMFAKGEGKEVDFEEAYAWSVLAAEGGDEAQQKQSDEWLAKTDDDARAEKRAKKLMKKYGQEALEEKARKREARLRSHEMGGCTGSKLGCSGG